MSLESPSSEEVAECFDRFCSNTRMKIYIKTPGQSVCCDVSPWDTLADLRARVERAVDGSDHTVVFAYHTGDDLTLKEHGLKNGSSIYAVRARATTSLLCHTS